MTLPDAARFEIGVASPAGGAESGDHAARAARTAEDLGFDWIGRGEHVMFHHPTASSLIDLAFVAGATTRIRLLSSIALAPLYPAALLAKMTGTLSILSGGRFEFGIGVGGDYPAEFAACGVDIHTRGARTDESLDVMRALWTGEDVDHAGKFWTVRGRMLPSPGRAPRVWVAGRKDAAVRRAARTGDVFMPYLVRPARLKQQIDQLAQAERQVGVVPYVFLHVDRDGDKARADAAAWVGQMYRQDPSAFNELVIAGTVDECVGRLEEMRSWGCSGVHLSLVCPASQWFERVELTGEEILPHFR